MQRPPRGVVFAPANPFARAFAVVAGLGLLALMLFLGVIFFAAFAALGAIAWLVFSVRHWWLTRGGKGESDPDIVDVEYRVMHSRNGRHDGR